MPSARGTIEALEGGVWGVCWEGSAILGLALLFFGLVSYVLVFVKEGEGVHLISSFLFSVPSFVFYRKEYGKREGRDETARHGREGESESERGREREV